MVSNFSVWKLYVCNANIFLDLICNETRKWGNVASPYVVFAKSSRLFIEFHKKIFHTIVGKYYTSKGRPVLLVHHNIV